MFITYLFVGGIALVVIIVVIVTLIMSQIRSEQRRQAYELLQRKDESGLALVRYVQLNRQCSEEAAYERLATFVKSHASLDNHPDVESMLAHDRAGLLTYVQSLLRHDSNILDKI